MSEVNGRSTVSILRACALAGVSRRTIYNWLKLNKVEYVRTAGGSVRIYVDTLHNNERRRSFPEASHDPKS